MRHVIPRWDLHRPILFFPELPTTQGRITCSTPRGGHSEISMGFYWKTRAISGKEQREAVKALLAVYEAELEPGEHLVIRKKDCARFQKMRWESMLNNKRIKFND